MDKKKLKSTTIFTLSTTLFASASLSNAGAVNWPTLDRACLPVAGRMVKDQSAPCHCPPDEFCNDTNYKPSGNSCSGYSSSSQPEKCITGTGTLPMPPEITAVCCSLCPSGEIFEPLSDSGDPYDLNNRLLNIRLSSALMNGAGTEDYSFQCYVTLPPAPPPGNNGGGGYSTGHEGDGGIGHDSDHDGFPDTNDAAPDDPGVGSGGAANGGGSSCFLTTVVVQRMGEPDDGETLTKLRWFRDEIMLNDPHYRAMVAEYYDIAPPIAKRLESAPKAQIERLYQHILQVKTEIELGQYERAVQDYRQMVDALR